MKIKDLSLREFYRILASKVKNAEALFNEDSTLSTLRITDNSDDILKFIDDTENILRDDISIEDYLKQYGDKEAYCISQKFKANL